jgi:hypothetical protein
MEFTERVSAELVVPCWMEIEFEDRATEKSGTGGGGGMTEEEPPPQPADTPASRRRMDIGTRWRYRPTR